MISYVRFLMGVLENLTKFYQGGNGVKVSTKFHHVGNLWMPLLG